MAKRNRKAELKESILYFSAIPLHLIKTSRHDKMAFKMGALVKGLGIGGIGEGFLKNKNKVKLVESL